MQNIQDLIKKYKIPVVEALLEFDGDMKEFTPTLDENFINFTKELQDEEGFVIRFDDGHMYKMKSDYTASFTASSLKSTMNVVWLLCWLMATWTT